MVTPVDFYKVRKEKKEDLNMIIMCYLGIAFSQDIVCHMLVASGQHTVSNRPAKELKVTMVGTDLS